MSLKVQCCFCGKEVQPVAPDPVILTLDVPGGGTQELPCHAACLKDRLHPSVPLAI